MIGTPDCCLHSRQLALGLALTGQDVDVAVLVLVEGLIGRHEPLGVVLFQSQMLQNIAAHDPHTQHVTVHTYVP